MKIQESGEDYLESILILSGQQEHVRATDIAGYFGYARATVSISMKHLKENGYIKTDDHNHITLTEKGESIARKTYEKHQFLSEFFMKIGVPKDIAIRDACRVEHYLSPETFQAMKKNFS